MALELLRRIEVHQQLLPSSLAEILSRVAAHPAGATLKVVGALAVSIDKIAKIIVRQYMQTRDPLGFAFHPFIMMSSIVQSQ